ncbi:pullulanase-type alpha-1,6-glucosidase [Actinomyces radicidentis]|uniref:pullulanase-type alpha-1,6-glucosidase n=1 Tax=Actinomyces radicidentis TaxID=111015 RepID=UPI0028E75EA8|nr:pullulanase-type alpha-1,6-glucosidase [Actinomyces radicidentis]
MSLHVLHAVPAARGGRRRLASVLAAAALALTGAGLATTTAPAVAADATPAATAEATDPAAEATDAAADFAVTVPGSHNTEMGCGSDWDVSCSQAALTYDQASGLFTGTFDLPAGTYEYKVAVDGTWDENYGANGVAGGDNVSYTTTGGKVTFLYDPASHVSWTNASEPIITLAGSFQAALGCGSDWAPACLAAAMRPQGDGTWTFTTNKIPTGSYQVKVSESLSWDVNYGVDGKAGGDNYGFSATAGKDVTFTYTPDTHVLTIAVTDPPAAGVGELDAYWIDATTLAWPTSLLPSGVARTDLVSDDGAPVADAPVSYTLVTSPDATASLTDGVVTGGTETALRVAGNLPDDVLAAHPNLKGYVALSLENADGDAALGHDEVVTALEGQTAVVQRGTGAAGAEDTVSAFTGVQTAIAVDALYGEAAQKGDLGATFETGLLRSLALWAPTAQKVTLLTWDTGDATGSVPEVSGEGVRHDAVRGDDGRWVVDNADGAIKAGSQYLWEVTVYAPSTGKIVTNTVTDPYSLALTVDSTRSVAVDLSDAALAPAQWASTASPKVANDASRTIYELHVRDFSASDETVPADERGTYLAFTESGSDGMKHLAQLAKSGVDTVHLLPTFDIASIEEDRSKQVTATVPDAGAASEEQQAAVASTADTDPYNWGYDPWHYTTPEGSYATDGHQDGGARTYQFRQMVGALHATGLQVVLDEVFNHTAAAGQASTSVLDKIVPGYYQRLDAKGAVQTSTCCSNTATENAMAARLMIDSVVTWARDYHVDGFRFDLMGYHSVATMKALRAALDELTVSKDGVNGKAIYLYGEGWNMGEIANNALFTTATQGQLDGTGIGTFNDRLRDAVHGGGPFDSDHRTYQGFGTGQYTDPNGLSDRSDADELADLQHNTDLVRLGLAGNLKSYSFTTSDGTVKKGSEIDYNGQAAGYASSPEETINYVDAHDNETLYDLGIYKLPTSTSMADRVRVNTVSLATVALGQSPSFWAAGTEMLRSKSLDRDSYNSGDYFNAIDWSGQTNGYAKGLPMASSNSSRWAIMRPLLENGALKPAAADIATSDTQAETLLRLRKSTPLFSLGTAALIQSKVSFPGSGTDATPGVIDMLIDDTAANADGSVTDVDKALDGVLVVLNASDEATTQTIGSIKGRDFALSSIQADGSDATVKGVAYDAATGSVTVPARTVAVLTDPQGGHSGAGDEPTAAPTAHPTAEPTTEPSAEPTTQPSAQPTTTASTAPTAKASATATATAKATGKAAKGNGKGKAKGHQTPKPGKGHQKPKPGKARPWNDWNPSQGTVPGPWWSGR